MRLLKIIHTADLHLDSRLETNLDSGKAQKRRRELILSFENVVKFARREKVRLFIIAGDIFDHKKVTQNTVQTVASIISDASEIEFLLLLGNHDKNNPFSLLSETPKNLRIFSDTWQYHNVDNVTVAGIELHDYNKNIIYSSLSLSPERYNIAVMHGDIQSDISLSSLKGKNIDYLALGHIHEHSEGTLDERGKYAYCGCLESRGFDESGIKGFYLIDTEMRVPQFVSGFAIRNMFEIEVDITDKNDYSAIRSAVACALEKCGAKENDMVKIVLTGTYTLDTNKDTAQLLTLLQNTFFFAKIKDKSRMEINAENYKNDLSLKGEFVRNVLSSELSDSEKDAAILYGIYALRGEEIE